MHFKQPSYKLPPALSGYLNNNSFTGGFGNFFGLIVEKRAAGKRGDDNVSGGNLPVTVKNGSEIILDSIG